MRRACSAFAVALLLAAAPARADKWALVVGINQYEDERITPLRYAVADALGTQQALVDPAGAGFPEDHVYLLTDAGRGANRPTNTNILIRLDALARRVGPEDTFLFYFSGHGLTRDGHPYLLSINANSYDFDTLQLSALPLEMLRHRLSRIGARQVFLILDACRNNPEAGKGDAEARLGDDFSRSVKAMAKRSAAGPRGTAVLFACSPGERAYEWPEKGHGVFSYYLVEALRSRVAAGGDVTAAAVADYIQQKVGAWSRENAKAQTPDFEQYGAARIVLKEGSAAVPAIVRELPTTATLRVTSEPSGATVTIGGLASGTTPYEVVVQLGAATEKTVAVSVVEDGYEGRRAEVTLHAGQVSEWRNVKLKPLAALVRPADSPEVGTAARATAAGEAAVAYSNALALGNTVRAWNLLSAASRVGLTETQWSGLFTGRPAPKLSASAVRQALGGAAEPLTVRVTQTIILVEEPGGWRVDLEASDRVNVEDSARLIIAYFRENHQAGPPTSGIASGPRLSLLRAMLQREAKDYRPLDVRVTGDRATVTVAADVPLSSYLTPEGSGSPPTG